MKKPNVTIILLSGKAGTGKSEVANQLENCFMEEEGLFHCENYLFAGDLKERAYDIGWDGQKDDRGRRLLQGLGQLGRDYDEHLWVDKVLTAIYDKVWLLESTLASTAWPEMVFTIDDCRFPNEITRVKEFCVDNEFDFINVRVKAPSRETLKDKPELYHEASETALNHMLDGEFDYIIDNEVTLGAMVDGLRTGFLPTYFPAYFTKVDADIRALGY